MWQFNRLIWHLLTLTNTIPDNTDFAFSIDIYWQSMFSDFNGKQYKRELTFRVESFDPNQDAQI